MNKHFGKDANLMLKKKGDVCLQGFVTQEYCMKFGLVSYNDVE